MSKGLQCVSLNVRGINDIGKRRKLFTWLQQKQVDICFLQETKLQEKNRKVIDFEWTGKCYHAFADAPKSGVSIIFKKNFNFEFLNEHRSIDGRKLIINIEIDSEIYSLVSIYAPNEETHRKHFIKKTEQWIKQNALNENNIIIGGDWNCCINDRERNTLTHIKDSSRKNMRQFIDDLQLIDMWDKLKKGCWIHMVQ